MSVLDNITRKVSDTAKAAAKMSGGMVEATRLNMSIGAEEEKIRKIHGELGKALYDAYSDGETINETLLQYCKKIDAINDNIDEMKLKLLELRNIKECPECQAELEIEMAYCYKCGHKQDLIVLEKAEQREENN